MQRALVLALLHVNQAFHAPRKPYRAAPLKATESSGALPSLNARGVTKCAVAAAEEEWAPRMCLRRSRDRAHVAAKKIYERRYKTVAACGGRTSGTTKGPEPGVCHDRHLPLLYLPLGTGNGVEVCFGPSLQKVVRF